MKGFVVRLILFCYVERINIQLNNELCLAGAVCLLDGAGKHKNEAILITDRDSDYW